MTEQHGKGQSAAVTRDPSEAIVVLMTAANEGEASRLAEMLVGEKLAACVQIVPRMTSVFLWKGTIMRQNEMLLIVKTERSRFEDLEREVKALHSYDTPEIIAVPITAGSAPYLEWLSASLHPQK